MPEHDLPSLPDLTGRPWSQARAELLARGFAQASLQVLDITPERAPRTPENSAQVLGWGEQRVVRASFAGQAVTVTVAREMALGPKAPERDE